jgi:hypothetical protein
MALAVVVLYYLRRAQTALLASLDRAGFDSAYVPHLTRIAERL